MKNEDLERELERTEARIFWLDIAIFLLILAVSGVFLFWVLA